MKRKLTKLNLEAIEKELPCLSEDDARAIVGGCEWLSQLWGKIKDFFSSSNSSYSWDCLFNSFVYTYNNVDYWGGQSGYQVSYEDVLNGYISEYGDPSKKGGAMIGDFISYIRDHYGVTIYQLTDGTVSDFAPTNMAAFQLDSSGILHFANPIKAKYDNNGNPTHIICYDATRGEEVEYSIDTWRDLFDMLPNFIDYNYYDYNYHISNYSYYV
jgi:hypothetical protein